MQKKLKLWAGRLFLFMVINSLVFTSPSLSAAASFPDIEDHWAKEYIQELSSLNHLNGYPDGTFKPDRAMSKAEFVTVLNSCLEAEPSAETTLYYQDTGNHWALGRINEAVRREILIPSEDPNGLRPDESIKRSQVAAMLVRALGKPADNGALPFNDRAEVEKSDYRGYIKTAYDLGLLSGSPNGNFEPFRNITRAEVCTVMSRFLALDILTPAISPSDPVTGSINTVVLGDRQFNLQTTPVYMKIDFTDYRINSIAAAGSSVLINGNQWLQLGSADDNPDLIVGNIRYAIREYSLSGNKLIASPGYRKFDRISLGTYTFNADYIKLYINSVNSEHYLSDLEIVDEYAVQLANKNYDLSLDKITVQLDKDFYDIRRVMLGDTETLPQLSKTDPVFFEGLSINDILAIFTGTTTLEPRSISHIDLIISGQRYTLSQVKLDAKGNFTVNGEIHPSTNVIMIINDIQYKINHIDLNDKKFIFYCDAGSTYEWVIINNEYRNPDDVRILWNGGIYELDEIVAVKRNVLRVNGKQYNLDSSFKLRFDNKVYDINRIDYDASLQATIIELGSLSTGYLISQPQKFIFFEDNYRLQEGISNVTIYVDYTWVDFNKILIADPSRLTYRNSNYELIGSRIRIDGTEYKIVDSSWHGLSQVLDLYLQET